VASSTDEMRAVAGELSDLLRTLAHPARLLALCELSDGARTSGELARRLGLREPAMSQQLAVLRHRGLVTTRRERQTIFYQLARPDLAALMRFLYAQYCSQELVHASPPPFPPLGAAAQDEGQ